VARPRSAFRKSGQQEEALSERETKLVERILGEPANFPAVFKTWVRAWVGEDPPPADWSTIIGAPERSSLGGGPVGAIYLWPTSNPPGNHLALNGAVVSRVTYKSIFDIFGVSFGAGDGSTTFGLPDTRGRVAVGLGTHADINGIGDNEGAAVGARTVKHQHTGATGSDGSHSHGGSTSGVGDHSHSTDDYQGFQFNMTEGTAGGTRSYLEGRGKGMSGAGGHSHSISTDTQGSHNHNVNVGPGGTPNDAPAFLTMLYIIRYA
jgi:microcystin-dependent protein